MGGGDWLGVGGVLAGEDHLDHRLTIDREGQRLAHPSVAAERGIGGLVVANVDGEAGVAEAAGGGELELGVLRHRLGVGWHDIGDFDGAGLEIGQTHGAVDHRAIDHPVEMDVPLVPIVGEAVERDVVLRDALGEFEGAGADRAEAEILAGGLGRFGRDHHAGAVSELGEPGGVGLFQDDAHRQRIDHLDAVGGGELVAAEAAGEGEVPIQRVFHRGRIHFLAVVEEHAGAEMQDDGLAVGIFPGGGEAGHHVQLGIEIDQLVADAGHHVGADEGARQRGVEDVGVVVHADAQRLGIGGGGKGKGEGGGKQTAHVIGLRWGGRGPALRAASIGRVCGVVLSGPRGRRRQGAIIALRGNTMRVAPPSPDPSRKRGRGEVLPRPAGPAGRRRVAGAG